MGAGARRQALILGGLVLAAVSAACGSSPARAHRPTTSSRATSTTTTSTTMTKAPSTTATTAGPPSTTTAVPTLGVTGAWAPAGAGFGEVRPAEVYLGGDQTGDLIHVTWSSWGGPQATGTGTSVYVAPNQLTYQGTSQTATVVAFDLGRCDGALVYKAVEWYFPQHGGSFDPNNHAMETCTKGYIGQPG